MVLAGQCGVSDNIFVGDDVVADGEVNRWNSGNDRSWVPLRHERVVEVAYDQMEGARLRHAAKFLRWRPDRDASSCTLAQIDRAPAYDLADEIWEPVYLSDDAQEGPTAFREKRAPQWKGR